MLNVRKLFTVIAVLLINSPAAFADDDATLIELDALWAEISRTVAEGDFEAYKATYHEDAILVSGTSKTSNLIAESLAGWKQGFMDTQAGKVKAHVEFRFTQRIHGAATAHETGLFHYVAQTGDGEPSASYVNFEALLINQDGWKMIMEYQVSPAIEEEWDLAKQ